MTKPPNMRREEGHQPIAGEVAHRIEAIVSYAERLADSIRRDAEAKLEEADAEAQRRVVDARHEADRIVAERAEWVSSLSQELSARWDAVVVELEAAHAARDALDRSLRALARCSDALTRLGGPTPPTQEAAPVEPDAPAARVPFEAEAAVPVEEAEATSPPPNAAESSASGETTPTDSAGTQLQPSSRADTPSDPPGPRSPVATENGDGGRSDVTAPASSIRGRGESLDGARMVAFQMALAGSTRAEVTAHLRRTFGITDPAEILGEAFGSRDQPSA